MFKNDTLVLGLIIALITVVVVNQYLIFNISSTLGNFAVVKGFGDTQNIDISSIAAEIIPAGVPEYGDAAYVSFDSIDQSLDTLVGYHMNVQLDEGETQRYIKIGTTRGTACEFCCGIGELGFANDKGYLLCGCSHNIAFSGLTKWLIKNTDYSDDEILQELKYWKGAFFPAPMVSKELESRGINPESVGLPAFQGSC